jgi:hypothetical protein
MPGGNTYMKKMKRTKVSIVFVSIIALMLMISPSVFAGAFKLVVNPPTTPIQPGIEMRQITGVTQLIPTAIETTLFPQLWVSQYTSIEVAETPEWAQVSFPDSNPITQPDSVDHEFTGFVSVSEDAPAYEYGTIKLKITTGKFARTIVPWFPGLNAEFNMDTSFLIQAGYLPLLTATNPPSREGSPNTNIVHTLHLINTGNARSLIQFKINSGDIPSGWSISRPASLYLNKGESIDIPVDVYTPRTFGYIDEWALIPMDINIRSVVEPNGAQANYSVTFSSHCIGYYAPIPGGNNPALLFGSIIGIIILVIVLIVVIIRILRKSPIAPKLKLKRKKEE